MAVAGAVAMTGMIVAEGMIGEMTAVTTAGTAGMTVVTMTAETTDETTAETIGAAAARAREAKVSASVGTTEVMTSATVVTAT